MKGKTFCASIIAVLSALTGAASAQTLLDVGAAIFEWNSYTRGVENQNDKLVYKQRHWLSGAGALGNSNTGVVETETYVEVVDAQNCVIRIVEHVPADPLERSRRINKAISHYKTKPDQPPSAAELEQVANSTKQTTIQLNKVYVSEITVSRGGGMLGGISSSFVLPGSDDVVCVQADITSIEYERNRRHLKNEKQKRCDKEIVSVVKDGDDDRFVNVLKTAYSQFCKSAVRGSSGRF